MKVTKINTSSFAISKDAARKVKDMGEAESKRNTKVTLDGKYVA